LRELRSRRLENIGYQIILKMKTKCIRFERNGRASIAIQSRIVATLNIFLKIFLTNVFPLEIE